MLGLGIRLGCVLLTCALAGSSAVAGEEPAPPPKEAPKPATRTVQPELLKIEAQLKGVFEAPKMTEVIFRPETWGELTVLEAAAAGARVKKGDVVLSLDTQKIDEAIQDAEAVVAQMTPALTLAHEEATALEKSLSMDLAAAERAKQYADEDLKRHQEIDRPSGVKQANYAAKNANDHLLYEQEELRQLEKMYKADNLTEETEEIVLKRQRDSVERAVFNLEVARIRCAQTLNVDLPRQDIKASEEATRQAINVVKAKASIPAALAKKQLELEKLKVEQKRAAERLAKLKRDRETMIVKSPADGILYYGPCVRGNWPKLGQELTRGTGLKPHEAVLTIVDPAGPLFVRAAVPEDQLERIKAGSEGHVLPTGYPSLKLRAKVESVTPIPVSPGNFEARLSVAIKDEPLVAGMTCTAKRVFYLKADALTVPASAVFEEGPEDGMVVYVRKPDGSAEKRPVTVGRKADGKTEILKGLSPGDVVLLEKPQGK